MTKFAWIIGVAVLSLWLGAALWFTFVQSPVLFKQMREIFAPIQLLLLPKYWMGSYIMLGLGAAALVLQGLPMLQTNLFAKAGGLAIAMAAVLLTQVLISPRVNELTAQMAATAKDPVMHQTVRQEFAIWHGGAMLLNLSVIVIAAAVLVSELARPPQKLT